jgi:serine/threonine protein phosphatase PrpC
MGTTMTTAWLGEEELSIAHVGDSRLYCLRDGALERLTRDHSLVEDLVREGRITPEEAEEHPQRSIVTRALGRRGARAGRPLHVAGQGRRRLPDLLRRADRHGQARGHGRRHHRRRSDAA